MSLMATLGKVAMGIVAVKGIGRILGGGGRMEDSGGALGDLLGYLIDDDTNQNGLGGVLDSLGDSKLGDLLNGALNDEATTDTTAEEETESEILLRAMIYATKADESLDNTEKSRIFEDLGDEKSYIENELMSPHDMNGFINKVPKGMEQQVYMMSLFAIDLDSTEEAYYLDQLAEDLNISHQDCNTIHEKLGAPTVYA